VLVVDQSEPNDGWDHIIQALYEQTMAMMRKAYKDDLIKGVTLHACVACLGASMSFEMLAF